MDSSKTDCNENTQRPAPSPRGDPAGPETKPRIALVTPLFPTREQPYRGQPIHYTALSLQRWGQVRVFCPVSRYPNVLKPVRFLYVRPDVTYVPPAVETEYFEYPVLPRVSRPLNGYICAGRLTPRLRAWKPDLILSYWLYPEGFASVLAGRRLEVPVVVGSRGSDLRGIRDWPTEHFTRTTLREAACVLTVSEDLRQCAILMGAPAERVTAVLNGCDRAVFHIADRAAARRELDVPAQAHLVLFVGRLDTGKGLEDLLAAAEGLREQTNLLVVCVGEGTRLEALKALAAAAGIGDRVWFVGVRSPQAVAAWLAAADVFCLPSHSEGCPNVVLEALACGRPVVATRVGGIPEVVNERCGILVPLGSAEALRNALVQALETEWDEQLIARQFLRSWDDVAADTFAVCRRMLRHAAAP
jgi:teichuronic acid biosynthesis glycosyltransferase TuaC